MKERILVSACLLGKNCKYNGKNNLNENLMKSISEKEIIEVCPEVMGGLSIPRVPSEIEYGKSGIDVIEGNARVVTKDGNDVTKEFKKGAYKTLEIVIKNKIKLAILKESSPSCGSTFIYNGCFNSTKKRAMGVTTALLTSNNIKVVNENFDNIE
ncbi:DUF523 domain-containing protein [Peptostreptococcus canis]|uniref:DUF523 domain-containing protein n=1 Tax=Peptostreptococcus canis TaxID=1159213 RepID=A0ABR6TLG3_9FIRM|nr:DUF523 domain-containing protein [Peptostreptococcus canis]MBC2576253.1 DUF523 domain-containing protein [Peptostreptococcus canis]MBP1998211.1 uncharacterized protein YbbK (DUF523 family) [Peptostreptococcus canis]